VTPRQKDNRKGELKDMTMIYKLANHKMANGLAFCSHVQEMHAKESTTAAGFVHELSTTMLRSFHRSLFEELVDDHQSYT